MRYIHVKLWLMTYFNKDTQSVLSQKQTINSTVSQTAIKSLAVIGLITLIMAGIMLAVYMVRFVPSVIGGFESSTVYLSGIISSNTTRNNLTVVPQTTIPFSKEAPKKGSSLFATSTNENKIKSTKPIQDKHVSNHTWAGKGKKITTQLYGVNGNSAKPTSKYYGLPDLVTTITSVGYIVSTSTNTFVKSTIIPPHKQVEVKFRIMNKGTNVTGPWSFEIHLPTEVNSIYPSKIIKSLAPGQPEDFIVHFTNAQVGVNRKIEIVADPNVKVKELHKKNNIASVNITILKN